MRQEYNWKGVFFTYIGKRETVSIEKNLASVPDSNTSLVSSVAANVTPKSRDRDEKIITVVLRITLRRPHQNSESV